MRDAFPKVVKWNISAFFLILGLYFMLLVEGTGNIQPIILAIFCFGIVYWLFKAKSEMSWQINFASALSLIIAGAAATYSGVTYGLLGMGFYPAWIGWTFLLGTPIMAYTYKNYG